MKSFLIALLVSIPALPIFAAAPPIVGEKAPEFALSTPEGKKVRLSDETTKGPVVLVLTQRSEQWTQRVKAWYA